MAAGYDELLARVQEDLSTAEKMRLIDDLSRHLGRRNGVRRLSELQGLGKDIWAGVDPDEYVRQERDSWDG